MEIEKKSKVELCNDGTYRWVYELEMFKDFHLLFTVFKIVLIASSIPFLVVFLSDLFEKRLAEQWLNDLKVLLFVFLLLFVLSIVAYVILAFLYGFKYIVLFEMNDESIDHIMQDKQATKAEIIGYIESLAGSFTHNTSLSGGGLLVSSHTRISSKFTSVKKVIGNKKANLIQLNSLFSYNQIYVEEKDYDFVYQYIKERCVNAKVYEK